MSGEFGILLEVRLAFLQKCVLAFLGFIRQIIEQGSVACQFLMAFLVVPMVGAFFIDIVNALVIKLYLLLPMFG